jgi:uncharacterized protein (TIGR04141 family)
MEKLNRVKIYLLKEDTENLEDALKTGTGQEPTKYSLSTNMPFDGFAYIPPVNQKEPDWLPFLSSGLSSFPELKTATASGLLLIETPKGHRFAVTFGYARYLLDPSSFVRGFGMQVALRRIELIRGIDMRRVEGLTLHTRRQASKASKLPVFGVDQNQDFIQSVAGLPTDENFAKRCEGSDCLTLAKYFDFDQLGELCDELYEIYSGEQLPEEFAFIENFRVVKDPNIIMEMDGKLKQALGDNDLEKMHLSQPEAESYSEINFYQYERSGTEHLELEIGDMVAFREESGKEMSATALKSDYVFVSYGHGGQPIAKWPAYDCIVFETRGDDGEIYILSTGVWHKARPEFIEEIELQLQELDQCDLEFPEAFEGEWEEDYNARAADLMGCKCAHPQKITIPGRTSIELCDMVTDRQICPR